MAEQLDESSNLDDETDAGAKNMTEIINSVYEEVWKEFYSWETDHCQQTILSLSSDERPLPPGSDLIEEMNALDFDGDGMITDEFGEINSFSVWHIGQDSGVRTRIIFDNIFAHSFEAYALYESCTPASKCITPRDDEMDEYQFIAYATDESWHEYAENLEGFAWQYDFKDPDTEMIQLETVRRLHFGFDFSFEDIDRFGVLTSTRIENKSGIIWDTAQRDQLIWPGSQLSNFDRLPINFQCDANDLLSRVNHLVATFCPNLNCIQPFCPTHRKSYPNFNPIKPTVTNANMVYIKGNPCGKFCFRHEGEADRNKPICWDSAEIENFTSILNIVPDLLPCELSVLCRKRCYEVFAHRSRIMSDDLTRQHNEERVTADTSRRRKQHFIDDGDNMRFTPIPPCTHKGLCDKQSGCECSMNNLHCQRNCRCALNCRIRWKGCKCKRNAKGTCKLGTCRCVQFKRECDPDLCVSCNARGAMGPSKSKKLCQNVRIQRGSTSVMEIKRSKFGLGGFATSSYEREELIGDYVGLAFNINSPLPQPRHNKGYAFDLNLTMGLDAARVGNETRFCNHKYSPENNCGADIFLVNGDHRIGIFATKRIAPGQELFLDYGPKYWEVTGDALDSTLSDQ